jgi:hypothetical protein
MVIAGIVTVLLESAQYGGPGTVQPAGQLWESENPRAEESFNEREFLSRPSHNLSSLRGMNTPVITNSLQSESYQNNGETATAMNQNCGIAANLRRLAALKHPKLA